jgi:hypothetical protein
MFKGIWPDLVYAGRSLAKARAFTLVCVVSLGIDGAGHRDSVLGAHTQDAARRHEDGGSRRTRDDAEWLVGAAIALLVAILAHARRAASVQPMVAMRST